MSELFFANNKILLVILCNERWSLLMGSLMKEIALGKKEKVKINAIEIPNAIIFPNSITGFKSPSSSDGCKKTW